MRTSVCIFCCLLLLVIEAYSLNQKEMITASFSLLGETFEARAESTEKYSEVIIGRKGTVALQRTAASAYDSLRLLELTNGTEIVQLVFSPSDQLVDCDFSNSRRDITRLLKHVFNKRTRPGEYKNLSPIANQGFAEPFTIQAWKEECSKLHSRDTVNELKTLNGQIGDTEAVGSTIGESEGEGNTKALAEQRVRQKRGLMTLVYPGTKWCGKGNKAEHYNDIGEKQHTDQCCRQHDNCEKVIPALTSAFNYFNYGLLTLSSCDCDLRFKACLQKAARADKDKLADLIGHLYFNVIGMSCFELEEKDQCAQSSWWGRCLKRERAVAASVKRELTY